MMDSTYDVFSPVFEDRTDIFNAEEPLAKVAESFHAHASKLFSASSTRHDSDKRIGHRLVLIHESPDVSMISDQYVQLNVKQKRPVLQNREWSVALYNHR